MTRREEITAERDRLAGVAKDIYLTAKRENREFTLEEDGMFKEAILVIEAIMSELKDLPEEITPIVKLDRRLTRPRTVPESVKLCDEFIDELEAEKLRCLDPNRIAGIDIEIETWRRERELACAHCNAILSQSRTRRLATV